MTASVKSTTCTNELANDLARVILAENRNKPQFVLTRLHKRVILNDDGNKLQFVLTRVHKRVILNDSAF